MTKNIWLVGIAFLIIGLGVGYWYGNFTAYKPAYDKAIADIKAQQEALAEQKAEEAAKAANPFQVANPLEGVEANPFDKAKEALNPFGG